MNVRTKAGLLVGALALLAPLPTMGQQSILLDASQNSPVLETVRPNLPDAPSDFQGNKPAQQPQPSPVLGAPAQTLVLGQIRFTRTSIGETLWLATGGNVDRVETQELSDPRRLVLDLYGVKASSAAKKGAQSKTIGKVRVGAHSGWVRVVVDVSVAMPSYQVQAQPNGLAVVFSATPRTAIGFTLVADDNTSVGQPAASKPVAALGQGLITIDLRDADLRNVLTFIANAGGFNIVAGSNASGRVTLRLKNVPWRKALQAILQVKGLRFTESAGIVRVLPKTSH